MTTEKLKKRKHYRVQLKNKATGLFLPAMKYTHKQLKKNIDIEIVIN